MAIVDTPTPADYPAIAVIARDLLRASDPSVSFDGTDLINTIEAGHPAMVIREHRGIDGEPAAPVVAFAMVHDHARGRIDAKWAVRRGDELYIAHAARCLEWIEKQARALGEKRGEHGFVIVTEVGPSDSIRAEALTDAGYAKARSWVVMDQDIAARMREIKQRESDASLAPHVAPNVRVRTLANIDDRRAAHLALEHAFEDHFNHFEESFDEWCERTDLYAHHRWDRDLLAELHPENGSEPTVIGTLMTSWLPESKTAHVEYLGVTREGRGKGAAHALLEAFYALATEHGFTRGELFVDADSPTGANLAYEKMKWRPDFRKETWHKEIAL
ncbi:GNAT family N-acetyltransferase [Dermabacter sp. p3-SID358]|uniref:GNAT family N-acetyltransferase n=1 Tax=Dermabacter sp. p3-SID358 TaxID=2916114 RepID=UPI0021A87464|nr:GNAT family N-acetyltransferase [Dermabacter sp. p3-SID358]MCT1866807.1 GNAT family N-acetyltransferase [Dermabacter sp. p3-SID358]